MNSKVAFSLQKITPLTEEVLNWVEIFPIQCRKVVEKDKQFDDNKKNSFVKGNSSSRRTQRRKEEREQCSGYTSETSNNIIACKQPDFFSVVDPVWDTKPQMASPACGALEKSLAPESASPRVSQPHKFTPAHNTGRQHGPRSKQQ